ncbi:MAG TPA: DUF669 domain-containing protein, partial [Nitrospira sp.]|nr:DUF669 domain-containing protein [Nitrospira sp.]
MAELNLDFTNVAPDTGFELVPDGWYNLMVDESEIKPTKDGTGAYLNVRITVIDGPMANRKIFTMFNIRNANPVAQEIAQKQLSALAHAVNVLVVKSSEQLHGIPFKGKIKTQKGGLIDKNDKDGGRYEDRNIISVYKNINEQVGDTAGGANAQAAGASKA